MSPALIFVPPDICLTLSLLIPLELPTGKTAISALLQEGSDKLMSPVGEEQNPCPPCNSSQAVMEPLVFTCETLIKTSSPPPPTVVR
jgi:hypothetical protein